MLFKYTDKLVETSKMAIVCVDTSGLDEGGLVIAYFVYSGKPKGVDMQLCTSRCWDYTILCYLLLYIKYKNWYHEYNSAII